MNEDDIIRSKCRKLFETDIGVDVLNHIGINCGFFPGPTNTEQMVLCNFFRWLLGEIGIWDPEHIDNGTMMRKLMELPLIPEAAKDVGKES